MENETKQIIIIPFANSSCNSYRFPDGTIETNMWKASQKAKELGMQLEERNCWRFSGSH